MADSLPRGAQQAADWAANFRTPQPGLCDHFVGLAYGLPHSGYESAAVHWQQTPGKLKHAGDRKPPIGALVYWDTGKKFGHVAIVSGYDKSGEPLITTTHRNGGTPTVMTLGQAGMTYLGWTEPYFGGKSAQVDMSTAGTPRAAGSQTTGQQGDPNDTSGVAVEPVTPDKLNKRELASEYGYAWKMIKAVPELKRLFLEAFNNEDGQWTEKKFGLAIKDTKWYKKNADYAREAIIAQSAGGADWAADVEEAQQYVKKEAQRLGITLSEQQIADYGERYIFEGWGQSAARGSLMTEALAEEIGANGAELAGTSANVADDLFTIATANGMKYDDGYYKDAARKVALGTSTLEDEQRRIREEAASAWPTYADQIRAGSDVRQLASSYINTYARVMEKDPYGIDLNDPVLRSAMTGVDDAGNFKPMGLWEFELSLRSKDEWMDTKEGQDTVVGAGMGVLRRMGVMG